MNTLVDLIAHFILTVSSIVIYGWYHSIEVFTSIRPDWVSMKLTTALCFVLTAIIILFANRSKDYSSKVSGVVMMASSFFLLFIMLNHVLAYLTDAPAIFETIVPDDTSAKTYMPGLPALTSIICFHSIGFWAKAFVFKVKNLHGFLTPIYLFASLAVLGYIFDVPLLYGFVEGKFTGMALHTAILFLVSAAALTILSKPSKSVISIPSNSQRQPNERQTRQYQNAA